MALRLKNSLQTIFIVKKILVTGANGQLGTALRKEAVQFAGFQFIYTDVAELDLCQPDAVSRFFATEKPDYVINCAAYTAVDKAEQDSEMTMRINRDAPKNLAEACKSYPSKLIHISTDYVFDGENSRPYHEEDTVNPQSEYGRTKLAGEQAILSSGAEAIVIRTAWLYSAYGNNFVKTMLRLGNEKEALNVVADQVGTPTFANDLASAILQIIAHCETGFKPFQSGVYHYSNEGVASWYDFAKAIFEMANIEKCRVLPIATAGYPTPAQRPAYSVLDKSKIKIIFELSIPYWRDALRECVAQLNEVPK